MSTLTRGRVRVELKWIGEGRQGDYNPEDEADEKLLRFYVQRQVDGRFEDVEDGSSCTQISDDSKWTVKMVRAEEIMDAVYDYVICGMSIKKICERLSWLS